VPQSRWVIVFAKAPVHGRVKTRLASQVGEAAATRIYRRMAERLWTMLLTAKAEEGFRLGLAFDPPGSAVAMRAWLPRADAYLPQAAGNLGDRIAEGCGFALDSGAKAVTVIGSDCPGLSMRHLAQGFEACRSRPLALGPADDGGFYALTLTPEARALLPRLPALPWSSPLTAARLLESASRLGLESALLPPLRDLDTLEDLAFHRRLFPWIDGFSDPGPCPF
jgi:rSAM/selenodomain-associated transferase 1